MCKIAEQIAKYAKQYSVELTIIANHPGLGTKIEKREDITIFRVPSFGSTFTTQLPSFGYFASKLAAKIQHNFDAIYSNYTPLFFEPQKPFISGFVATRYGEYIGCQKAGKPIHAFINRLYIPLDKLLIKSASAIIVNSQDLVAEISAMGGKKTKFGYFPSGVDTEMFQPTPDRSFNSTEKTILCVSRLDSRKGIDILLQSCAALNKKEKVHLVIGGDGPEMKNLVRLADTLPISISFLGALRYSDLPNLYNRADLFVLPSLYEGMPLVALEAMACGTPTIISDASPDIGVPNFAKGSVSALTSSLSEIIPSEKRLQELSTLSLAISQNYSWQKIVAGTFSFIRECAGGSMQEQSNFSSPVSAA
jgi:glycosyltransferase involved in cell wall biosynthesis